MLLECLEARFQTDLTYDIRQFITQQETLALVRDWYRAALRVPSYEDFLAVLRR
jgi:hypothetical protein